MQELALHNLLSVSPANTDKEDVGVCPPPHDGKVDARLQGEGCEFPEPSLLASGPCEVQVRLHSSRTFIFLPAERPPVPSALAKTPEALVLLEFFLFSKLD